MTNSGDLADKHARIDAERRRQIREWVAYVRTHPDEDWGAQVNETVDSPLQAARHFEDERPDMDELRESPLLDG